MSRLKAAFWLYISWGWTRVVGSPWRIKVTICRGWILAENKDWAIFFVWIERTTQLIVYLGSSSMGWLFSSNSNKHHMIVLYQVRQAFAVPNCISAVIVSVQGPSPGVTSVPAYRNAPRNETKRRDLKFKRFKICERVEISIHFHFSCIIYLPRTLLTH